MWLKKMSPCVLNVYQEVKKRDVGPTKKQKLLKSKKLPTPAVKVKRLKGDAIQRSLKVVKDVVKKVSKEDPELNQIEIKGKKGISQSHYPGRTPVDKERLEYHSRGESIREENVKTNIWKKKLKKQEKKFQFANELAARTELLLTEDSGFLVPDEGEVSTQFTQREISDSVDIASASKHFDLQLPFGSYRMNYSLNGRHLLLGGRKGHVAAFDWVTKTLSCEMNVMEEVFDVQWLHIETMFAVAQKNWVYIYDNQGIELHCLKNLHHVLRMEFLPYHFLLATCTEAGYLSWLDVSIGKLVSNFNTRMGRLNIMTQNPYNAVLCLGHAKGVVTMWSPNMQEPLAKLLCHKHPIRDVAVDTSGMYMATCSIDRSLKIWDIRKLVGPLQLYNTRSVPTHLSFSQQGLLAVGLDSMVEIYQDCCKTSVERPYMRHQFMRRIGNLQFCPYEDVLGVGTSSGFTSLLIPGAGEANFDALESNPFQSKSQRREAEVKALLDKIQPELISLDPSIVTEVDVPTLKEKMEAKSKLLFLKPPKVDYQHRKGGRRKGTAKAVQTKKILQEQSKREFIETVKDIRISKAMGDVFQPAVKTSCVLDRFKPKVKPSAPS